MVSQKVRQPRRPQSGNSSRSPAGSASSQEAGARPKKLTVPVRLGDEELVLSAAPAEQAGFDETAERIREYAESACEPPVFHIDQLLDFEDERRWTLLNLIHATGGKVAVLVDGKQKVFSDLFDAVVTRLTGDRDMTRCKRAIRGALEAAVLQHPATLEMAVAKIRKRLQSLDVHAEPQGQLVAFAKQLRNDVARHEQQTQPVQWVRELLSDVSCPQFLAVPKGWRLDANGVARLPDGGARDAVPEQVLTSPMLITRRFRDAETQQEYLELAWKSATGWVYRTVSRGQIASNDIVGLASYGAPVHNNNRTGCIQYLADFEHANQSSIPQIRSSGQMGWLMDGDVPQGFLFGREFIAVPTPSCIPGSPASAVFRGADAGDEQIASGFHKRGNFDQWLAAVNRLRGYPRVVLALRAALAAPFLRLFGVQNFVLDFCAKTTVGKTSTLQVASSCAGNPEERSAESAIFAWSQTRVARERAASIVCDMAFVIDDTKRAKRKEEIPEAIYDYAQGIGRLRGSTAGLRNTAKFYGVMISSGESPATANSRDGGTHARVLTICGKPLGEESKQMGDFIDDVVKTLLSHYGHAIPKLISHVVQRWSDLASWREAYKEQLVEYERRAGNNAVARRLARPFALLTFVGRLAFDALGILPPEKDPVDDLWDELVREARQADVALTALELVVNWAAAHPDRFWSPVSSQDRVPPGGWVGRRGGRTAAQGAARDVDDRECISFIPHCLKQILEEAGFEYEAVVREWAGRDWLQTSQDNQKRHQKRIRIDGKILWLYALDHAAMVALEPNNEPEQGGPPSSDGVCLPDDAASDGDEPPPQVQVVTVSA